MNNELKKAKIGIACSIVTLLFSIFIFFSINGSTAWFMQNENAEGNGMGISIVDLSGATAEIKSYAVSTIDKSTTPTTYELASQNGEFVELNYLPQYDPNNISSNQYKMALIVEIKISATQAENLNVMATTIHSDILYTSSNYVSNAVVITPVSLNGNVATKTGTQFAFVTKNAGSTQCSKVTSGQMFSGSVVAGMTTLYYVVEYNLDFLSAVAIEMSKTGNFETINYTNDIVFQLVKPEN